MADDNAITEAAATTEAAGAAAAASAAQDDARAKAEARRLKILEKSKNRMGVVSGEMALGEEEKKATTAKAARIRAARRRYKNKTAAATAAAPATGDEAKTTTEDNPKEASGVLDAAGETPPAAAETQVDATTSEEKPDSDSAAESKAVAEETVAAAAEDNKKDNEEGTAKKENENAGEPKKKYMGVARMRRKMIMKKKAEAEEGGGGSQTTAVESVDKAGAVPAEPIKPVVTKARAIPVIMYMVTLFLLFFAGFDFGLQQYQGGSEQAVVVHQELAFQEFGFSRFNFLKPGNGGIKSFSNSFTTHDSSDPAAVGENDEFEDVPILEDDDPQIDPLFGVDLDALTKGPGVVLFFARGAVAAHRFLLLLFFYGPKNFVRALLEIPKALTRTPPWLAVIAIVVRQVIGKTVLRAEIPAPIADEKDQGIDVVSMVKNGIMNFLKSTFPTAVGLYSGFVHLRADMYIIIFGTMCGMIWADKMKGAKNLATEDIDGSAAEL